MLLPLSIIMVLYAVLTFYFRSKYLEKKQASHPSTCVASCAHWLDLTVAGALLSTV